MANAEKFWDKNAEKYAKSPIKNIPAYKQTMDHTKKHLSKQDTALEIGCGTGSTALLLAENVKHITATDISSNMIKIAQDKVKDQQIKNASFAQKTLFDNTLTPGSFDVILAYNILHLLEDTPKSIGRIKELLKPGGIFISKTVCLAEKSRLWRFLIFIMNIFGLAPNVSFLKVDELEGYMTDENFQIMETGMYPASWAARFIVAKRQ